MLPTSKFLICYEEAKAEVGAERSREVFLNDFSNNSRLRHVIRRIPRKKRKGYANLGRGEPNSVLSKSKQLQKFLSSQDDQQQWISQDETGSYLAYGYIGYSDPVRKMKQNMKI
jgi:hypothetical protein